MTKQQELWANKFGDRYEIRNGALSDLKPREEMWRSILGAVLSANNQTPPESYYEVGAGNGRNIIAINDIYADGYKPNFGVCEIHTQACDSLEALEANIKIDNKAFENIEYVHSSYDLVYTSGVLIHVHPDNLVSFMRRMYEISRKFIVVVEYFSPKCREIEYRGERNVLWANDFGSILLDNFNVRCIGYGFRWKRVTGLDDLSYFIFQKVN